MKYSEIKTLTKEELQLKLSTEQKLLRKLSFSHAISAIENPMKLRATRKTIARLMTAINSIKYDNQEPK